LTIYREVPGSRSRSIITQSRDAAVLISAENIASALGESTLNQAHRDVAALLLCAYDAVSADANLASMSRMIEEAAGRISEKTDAADLSERAMMKIADLRHHYTRWRLQNLLGPAWPLADALWRLSGLKYLRQYARAAVP
jgi:hypothetical protein